MSDLFIVLKCYIIGLTVASLIGPIALLCFRKSLEEGALSGFCIGLGAATADGLYGFIASFGISSVIDFVDEHSLYLKIFGAVMLCYLGIKSKISARNYQNKSSNIPDSSALLGNIATTFILTISNPATIIIFMSIFMLMNIDSSTSSLLLILMVAGFFCGSLTFYAITSFIVSHIGHKLSHSTIRILTIVSGCIILFFGLYGLTESFLL